MGGLQVVWQPSDPQRDCRRRRYSVALQKEAPPNHWKARYPRGTSMVAAQGAAAVGGQKLAAAMVLAEPDQID